VLFPLFFLLSCETGPAPREAEPEPAPAPVQIEATVVSVAPETFDPNSITKEQVESTRVDVQRFIEDLTRIIRAKNYQAWIANLDPEYLEHISSPEFLSQISNSAALRSQRIVLKTPEDYFTYVVVPSRANNRILDHVDEIEYVSKTGVIAYSVTTKGDRVRLYDLESTENGWKIVERKDDN
jgi:hypothetical protein